MKLRVVKWPMPAISTLAVIAALTLSATSDAQSSIANNGGHFRFATIYWKRVDDPNSNTVEITVESAWRRSYSSSYFTPAQNPSGQTVMKINGKDSPVVDFGDGTIRFMESVQITAYSSAEDWFMGIQKFTKVYDTPTNQGMPWVVTFKGCCRLSNLQTNRDTSWNLQTNINLIESGVLGNFSLKTSGGPGLDVAAVTWSLNAPWSGGATGYVPPGVTLADDGRVQARLACPSGGATFCLWYVTAYATLDTAAAGGGGGDAGEGGGGMVSAPVDLILNVTMPAATDPVFDLSAAAAGAAAGDWAATLYPGFEYTVDVGGYLSGGASAGGGAVYVGFTVGPLPPGAHLSTVRGKGSGASAPAQVTLRWTPTAAQLGTSVLCLDTVNSLGVAATQRCLVLSVVADPAPTLALQYNGVPLQAGPRPRHQCPVSPCYYALAYMGRVQTVTVVATDSNPADSVVVEAVAAPPAGPCNGTAGPARAGGCPLLPPGAALGAPTSAVVGGALQVTRVLTITPAFDDGGALLPVCFRATDSCGAGGAGGTCPGVVDTASACVWVQVQRCAFVVQQGQQLQEVAAIYGTDWLQLWSHNLDILHPDMDLAAGSTLALGHEYAAQPYEPPSAVARRFGMAPAALVALNADLARPGALERPACDSLATCDSLWWCVLPNSCAGSSSSVYGSGAAAAAPASAGA